MVSLSALCLTAQSTQPTGDLSQIFLPLMILVAFVIAGGIIITLLRRKLTDPESSSKGQQPFTLQELRDMHGRGQLTDEEFEQARDAMIKELSGTSDEHLSEKESETTPGNSA